MNIYPTFLMLPAKSEGVNAKTVAQDGNNGWLFTANFHEIGSDQQRSDSKRFSTMDAAKQYFEERATSLCKLLARLPNTSIQKGESALVITQNGNPVVRMAYLPEERECA